MGQCVNMSAHRPSIAGSTNFDYSIPYIRAVIEYNVARVLKVSIDTVVQAPADHLSLEGDNYGHPRLYTWLIYGRLTHVELPSRGAPVDTQLLYSRLYGACRGMGFWEGTPYKKPPKKNPQPNNLIPSELEENTNTDLFQRLARSKGQTPARQRTKPTRPRKSRPSGLVASKESGPLSAHIKLAKPMIESSGSKLILLKHILTKKIPNKGYQSGANLIHEVTPLRTEKKMRP